jgi:hypothetical protein
MREPLKRPSEKTSQKALKYFTLAMTLVYPVVGLFLYFSRPHQIALPAQTKMILGIMLVLYGIFRFYRTYQKYFKHRNEADDEL